MLFLNYILIVPTVFCFTIFILVANIWTDFIVGNKALLLLYLDCKTIEKMIWHENLNPLKRVTSAAREVSIS